MAAVIVLGAAFATSIGLLFYFLWLIKQHKLRLTYIHDAVDALIQRLQRAMQEERNG
jgi:hypothetical protein